MSDPHAAKGSVVDDEPKSPMWLPALGAALFVSVGLWWATSTPPAPPADQSASSTASAAPAPPQPAQPGQPAQAGQPAAPQRPAAPLPSFVPPSGIPSNLPQRMRTGGPQH